MHRPFEKCGQNVVKFGEFKKKDLVKCLKINNLQSLVVPRAETNVLVAIGGLCVFIGDYSKYSAIKG